MANIELNEAQIAAVNKMKNGCILCGGVGSGKSRTALAYYYLRNDGCMDGPSDEYCPMGDPPKDLYIITTARKRDTLEWDSELALFLLSTKKELNLYCNKVVVDSWNNIKKYSEISKAFFIFDEQRVIGRGAWVKSFLKIAKANEWVLLSATPGDTWMDYIPVFIANGFYKNRRDFEYKHVIYSRFSKFPKVDRYLSEDALKKLRDDVLVDIEIKRATIRHHIDVYCLYDQLLYKSIGKKRWNPYSDKPITSVAELCYTWRKVVNSDPSRIKNVLDIINEHHKVIVFYNYDYEIDALREALSEAHITRSEWNGHLHRPIPNGEEWAYLVQYTAGSEAWNCIETDTIIFYSSNYSYRTMEQASGRIDRLNTPFIDLYYYYLKSSSAIDRAIDLALKNKKNFNEKAFIGKKEKL